LKQPIFLFFLFEGKKVAFVGDDTWSEMFPDAFDESTPCPSFDIMDLDSVDNVVKRRLRDEFDSESNNKTRYDVLIAHFLGVDHAGHRHGRGHPEMRRKLGDMNDVLEELVSKLEEEAVLVVLGDHGMTITGDHGGDTDDEVDAGLLVYSKSANFRRSSADASQIDLVPTLAWLTGVPIPMSNVGTMIWDLLPVDEDFQIAEYSTTAAAANYLQVKAFLDNYPLLGFPADERKALKKLSDQIAAVSCEEEVPSRLKVCIPLVHGLSTQRWKISSESYRDLGTMSLHSLFQRHK
jgi:phosphatidylinositol glycan class O